MMELSIVVKATVVLAIGLAAARAARGARASVRHAVLASTFAALVMLPLAAAFMSPVSVELSIRPADFVPPPDLTAVTAVASGRAAEIVRHDSLEQRRALLPPTAMLQYTDITRDPALYLSLQQRKRAAIRTTR